MQSAGEYKATCEYLIVCESPALNGRPFPPCSDTSWGAGRAVNLHGLVPAHRTALIAATERLCAQLSFTKLRPVRLRAALVREGVDDSTALDRCVSVSEQPNQARGAGYNYNSTSIRLLFDRTMGA